MHARHMLPVLIIMAFATAGRAQLPGMAEESRDEQPGAAHAVSDTLQVNDLPVPPWSRPLDRFIHYWNRFLGEQSPSAGGLEFRLF